MSKRFFVFMLLLANSFTFLYSAPDYWAGGKEDYFRRWSGFRKQNIKDPQGFVFCGGGAKGIAYSGVIKALDELGLLYSDTAYTPKSTDPEISLIAESLNVRLKVKKLAGASAGAITAVAINLGYTSDETYDLMMHTNFAEFLDAGSFNFKAICNDPMTNKLGLVGLFSSSIIYRGIFYRRKIDAFLESLFVNKLQATGKAKELANSITFRQLHDATGIHLVLTACSLGYRRTINFDYINTPNVPVLTAMQGSMSIPVAFPPVLYNPQKLDASRIENFDEIDYLVDGGTTRNYPIDVFDDNTNQIVGFVFGKFNDFFDPQFDNPYNGKLMLYDLATVLSLITDNVVSAIESGNAYRTIFLNTLDVGTLDFDATDKQKANIINLAYNSVLNYFGR